MTIVGPADTRALVAAHEPALAGQLAGVAPLTSPPVQHLVSGLLAAGVQVDVVTCSPSIHGPVVARGERLSVFVAPYRPRGRARDGFRQERRGLAALLRETSGVLVHAHWTYEFALATLRDPRPRLVTIHDAPLTILRHTKDPYRAVRAGMAGRVRASRFTGIAVSPYLALRWRAEMRDRRPLHVIPDPVVVPAAGRDRRIRAGRVVCVADASRRKNVPRLVEAVHLLRSRLPAAHLVVAGAGLGPDGGLAAAARRSGMGEAVSWRGPLSHPEALGLIAGAEVLAHPSLEESFGMTVAEAMALGVPVVAGARSGAVPWLLGGGDAGVLTDVTFPPSMAAGIGSLLADEALAHRVRDRALLRSAGFSRDAVVAEHVRLYESMAAR